MQSNYHVFFPGGRDSDLLNDWEDCLRSGVPIYTEWSAAHLRQMLNATKELEAANTAKIMMPDKLRRARRMRRLCSRSLTAGNLDRASKLMRLLITVLAEVMTADDAWYAARMRIHRIEAPRSGGRKSGESRRKMRSDDLEHAAVTLRDLQAKNPIKKHTLQDIADASGLTLSRLQKLTKRDIDKLVRSL